MNVNLALWLKEQYGPRFETWQEQQSPPVVRFWCDDGTTCWGDPVLPDRLYALPSRRTDIANRMLVWNDRHSRSLVPAPLSGLRL
jgi:hypothetical protein